MRVMKFGGTSVGTIASLRNVKHIVEKTSGPVVVVVSALGGVTDMLIKGARLALSGVYPHDIFLTIETRHRDIIFSPLVRADQQIKLWEEIAPLLTLLRDYYKGIGLLHDLSDRTLCNVVSLGERMSSLIVSHIIRKAAHFQSMDFIKTERWFGKNIAVPDLTDSLIRESFASLGTSCRVAVVPGFISTDRDTGDITNLGRGGSDYTAALIAAALDAEGLDIWTDVDGFMTADPRIIHDAKVIPHLSFLESMDLCNFGAKVIYPPTIYPVFHKNIPIRILNTFRPEARGTIVTDAHKATALQLFRGVTSIAEVSVITVGETAAMPAAGMHTRVLNVLSKHGIEVLLSSASQSTMTAAVRRSDAGAAMQALREDFAGEGASDMMPVIEESADVSAVSAVGENLKLHPDTSLRLAEALRTAGIDVIASATGASGFTFTMIVPAARHHEALETLHSLI